MKNEKKKLIPSKKEMSYQERYDRNTRIIAILSIASSLLGLAMTIARLLLQ